MTSRTEAHTRDFAILLAAALLSATALLMPPIDWPRTSYDYLVVFDITQSMDVEDHRLDGKSVSRLGYAREALRQALPQLPCGSRVGLGAFTEYRSLMLLAPIEVCANYNALLGTLANVDGRMRWADASQVAKGLYWALRGAREIGGHPDLIFISDGHESPPLTDGVPVVFGDIQPGDIRGWVIGVGGLAPRPIPRTDASGRKRQFWRADEVLQTSAPDSREHLSARHDKHLQSLATQLDLAYQPLDEPASLSRAMTDPRFGRRQPLPTNLSWLPIALALALLCWQHRPRAG